MSESGRTQKVVLLGFMCSGKSTVARSLSQRLEWDLLDFDVEIERREGRSVAEVIDTHGEDYFRDLEVALTDETARNSRLVIAPGGGWITNKGVMKTIHPGTLSAWLQVSAPETVRRLRDDPMERPFKHHPDPQHPIEQMIAEREPLYRLADHVIPTDDRSVESIAFELEQIVRLRSAPALP